MIITSAPATKSTGFSISTSNVLRGLVPVVTDGGIGEVASNITDPDHSLTFSSGTSVSDFSLSFGVVVNLTYVAISGHDAATPSQATIELFDGVELVDSVVLKRNNNVMFTFGLRSFTDLIIKFVTVPNNFRTTVSYIAAGVHLLFTQGEQAGYKRLWLSRHLESKSVSGISSAPIVSVKERKQLKASVNFPHTLISRSRGDWQDFLDFAESEPFFINEVNTLPESTYLCYDQKSSFTAHSSTRALDSVRLSFTAYNGL